MVNASKNGPSTNVHRFAFDNFEVDPANRILLRDGEAVALNGKASDILLALVENPGRLLEKDELLETVWPGDFVEEGNLTRNVSFLRKALGDLDKQHKYIATVQGHGYRFVSVVAVKNGPLDPPAILLWVSTKRRPAKFPPYLKLNPLSFRSRRVN